MATTVSLGKSAFIEEFVDGGDSITIKYSSLSLNDIFAGYIEFPMFNVYDDYIDELKSICVKVNLEKEDYIKYYQAPKLLANDIYRNSELDFIIMRLNGIYDPKDFTFRQLLLPPVDPLNKCLSKIYTSNRKFIETYNQDNPLD